MGIDNPSTQDLADAVAVLNDTVHELDHKGRWLWTVSTTPSTLTLVTNQREYATGSTATTIATYIQELERVEVVDGSTYRPLQIISRADAISIYERENSGEPVAVYLLRAPNPANQKMGFLPTPSSAYSVQYYYRRMLYDFDNSSDNPDFPKGANLNLITILAAQLAPLYGASMQMQDRLDVKAEIARKDLRAMNEEKVDRTTLKTIYY